MKPKIPTVKIKSDECFISIGQIIEDGAITHPGVPHYVHEGEWVEIMPVMAVREVMQLSRLQRGGEDTSGLGENLSQLCKELSKRIIKWNWTNLMGEPMQQPYDRPEVLESLSSDELLWLVNASSAQEAPEARKKDSATSANISSATALSP
tara:strand:+ start:1444 stop:1896 length:453 start_codon:yes stop_codon:yes gene_type:complete